MHLLLSLTSSSDNFNPTQPLRSVSKVLLKRVGSEALNLLKVTEDMGSYRISILLYSGLYSGLHRNRDGLP